VRRANPPLRKPLLPEPYLQMFYGRPGAAWCQENIMCQHRFPASQFCVQWVQLPKGQVLLPAHASSDEVIDGHVNTVGRVCDELIYELGDDTGGIAGGCVVMYERGVVLNTVMNGQCVEIEAELGDGSAKQDARQRQEEGKCE